MRKCALFSMIALAALLSNQIVNAQITVSYVNSNQILSDFSTSAAMNNSLNSGCKETVNIPVPDGAVILSAQANYQVTAVGTGWISEARSFIRVLNSNGGTSPVQQTTGNTIGTATYNLNLLPLINGAVLNNSELNLEFHLFRTFGNSTSGCQNLHQFVPVSGLNITITYAPGDACFNPLNLSASDILNTSANINWVGNGDSYQISYGLFGITPTDGTIITSNNTSITLANLEASSTYSVFVKSICGDENSSWSSLLTFTTLCDSPIHTLISPYSQDFEDCNTWTILNGNQTNRWIIGQGAAQSGSKSIYITTGTEGLNTYNGNVSSVVFFYKDFIVPSQHDNIEMSFQWRGIGEGFTTTFFDFLRVFVAPVSFIPTVGIIPTPNATNGVLAITPQLNNSGNWQLNSSVIPGNWSGQTMRLIFMWRNDLSIANQPPAAVDNIFVNAIPNPNIDIELLSLNIGSTVCLGQDLEVSGNFRNGGLSTLSFEDNPLTLSATVTGSITQNLTQTINSGTLAPGQTANFSAGTLTIAQPGNFNVSLTSSLVGDQLISNNGPLSVNNISVANLVPLPQQVTFINYTGGNINTINSNWNSQQNFTLAGNATQLAGLGQPTVRYNMWSANGNAIITSPYFKVSAGIGAYWGAALTKWLNANTPDAMLVGDSVNVFIQVCGEQQRQLIWSANASNNLLNNTIQYFEYPLNNYVGEDIRLIFHAKTTLASGNPTTRDNDIHFAEFFIGNLPECSRPQSPNLSIVEPTMDNDEPICVQFSWIPANENQFIFEVYYGAPGFNPLTEGNMVPVFVDNNFTLCNLISGAEIEFVVRTNCGASGMSLFSNPVAITIPQLGETCALPIVIPTLPFLATNVNTLNFGNNHSGSQLIGSNCTSVSSNYLNGNEVVYSYTALMDEEVTFRTFNIQGTWSSMYIMEGCPGSNPVCLAVVANSGSAPREATLNLEEGTTVNVIISTWPAPQTVTFNFEVFKVVCPLPSLPTTNVLSSSEIQLSWTDLSNNLFEVIYGLEGFSPATEGTLISNINQNSVLISGLNTSTTYQFYVRSICDAGISNWIGPATAQTACGIFSLPFYESFSGSVSCWNFQPNWSIHTPTIPGFSSSISGAPYARFNWTPSLTNYERHLLSPIISVPQIADDQAIYLGYRVLLNNFDNASLNQLSISWRIEGASNWNSIVTHSNSLVTGSGTIQIEENSLEIFGTSNQNIQLRFTASGGNSFSINQWNLDDVSLSLFPILVGIEEQMITKDKGSIFPNPASKECYLKAPKNLVGVDVMVFNSYGKTVKNFRVNKQYNEIITIPLDGLSSGLYVVKLIDVQEIYTYKVIVK
ncbi:MAG: fibronectin type III domain-containing protein [Luteibaculaceae bacterium]